MKKATFSIFCFCLAFAASAQTAPKHPDLQQIPLKPQAVVIDRQTDTQDVFGFKGVEISLFKTAAGYTVVFEFENGKFFSEALQPKEVTDQRLHLTGNNHNEVVIDCESGAVTLFQNGFKAAVYEN
jgi:hypothetical protein